MVPDNVNPSHCFILTGNFVYLSLQNFIPTVFNALKVYSKLQKKVCGCLLLPHSVVARLRTIKVQDICIVPKQSSLNKQNIFSNGTKNIRKHEGY